MNGATSPGRRPASALGPVAGVDGCRGSWLVVRRGPAPPTGECGGGDGRTATAELVDDLEPLVQALRRGELAALAVNMPIGLLDHHPRACEVEARRLLGPRRSSVFPSPIRALLDVADYDEARVVSRSAVGKAPSRQTFNLVPAIRHLHRLVRAEDQDRLVEAHPELAFARLAGEPLPHPKRTVEGRALRRDLLLQHEPNLQSLLDAGDLPLIDLLDATVLTVTADRVTTADERRIGPQPTPDGRRSEIVW